MIRFDRHSDLLKRREGITKVPKREEQGMIEEFSNESR